MDFFLHIYNAIKRIVVDGCSINDVLNDHSIKTYEDKNKYDALILNVIKNFELYKFLVKENNIDFSILFILYLANRQVKAFNQTEIKKCITSCLKDNKYEGNIKDKFDSLKELDINKPSSLDEIDDISVSFNITKWQAKMLIKQYGYKTIKKALAYKMEKGAKKRIDKIIVDSLHLTPFDKTILFLDKLDSIFIPLLKKAKADIIMKTNSDFYKLDREIKINKLIDRCKIYESDINALTSLISNKVNYFILAPESSNFIRYYSSLDFSFQLKGEQIDYYFKNDITMLENASKFVEDYGYIYYFVPTLSEKESTIVVDSFLKNHKEFTLTFDRQYMPYEKEHVLLYLAILRKDNFDGEN